MRILGISGSVRRGSHNLTLLRAAEAHLPPTAELEAWRGIADLPAYDENLDAAGTPVAVAALRLAISRADAVIIATPEYNSSIPGALKNALDWASRPWPENSLRGKAVGVIGASTGLFGAVWAQAELRKVLTTIGANVIDRELAVGQAQDAFDEHGRLEDPHLRHRLAEIVAALLEQATTSPQASAGPTGSLRSSPRDDWLPRVTRFMA
ncbi:MAG TPA: NAD(P)H-dependent oxidoreductase [Solirubrobacteraceae bacterium]|nr:NAD(P)H-dependent oxidoreductase [Solirubrobacteraceae bacterium]